VHCYWILVRQKTGGASECAGIVGEGVYVVCYIIVVRAHYKHLL